MSENDKQNARDLLYISESCDNGVDEDIWDDRKLNDAYDKAIKIANAEVAKRIAMSTNSQQKPKQVTANAKKGKSTTKSKKNSVNWKSGMPCRAVYESDGIEYEAFILKIISDKECLVRFLGYDNTELVEIDSLKPSQGKEARNQQIEQTLEDKFYEDYSNQSCGEYADSERVASPQSTEKSFNRHKKAQKKKNAQKQFPQEFNLPEVPPMMPNMNFLRNAGTGMPLPPPPPLPLGNDVDDDGLSSMLISWYMSGYYTGLYQGIQRGKQSAKNGKF